MCLRLKRMLHAIRVYPPIGIGSDSYSGDIRFVSWPGCLLYTLFLLFSSVPSVHCQENYLEIGHSHFHQHPFQVVVL
jgi:hypothetical protein